MNNDLIILIIIIGVTVSAVIMFVFHVNEVDPGDAVLYTIHLAYPTGSTENNFNFQSILIY